MVDFKKISKHEGPEESPGFLLWRVSTLWRRALEKTLKAFDLTHPQFVILATTAWFTKDCIGASQADIARKAGLDPNTTSQILRGLQTKGLIERNNSVNERSKNPSLTKKGSIVLSEALPAVEAADTVFFSSIDLKKSGLLTSLQTLGY